jgi:hypothetical protein
MCDNIPFVANAKWFLDRAMVTGRYSAGLIREFDAHVENGTANIFPIFEEIGALEGAKTARPSRTKPACHHCKPERLQRLITKSFGGREFVGEQAGKDLKQAVGEFSKGYVHDGYLERGAEGELTGEWVVFAKQDGANYYLTLGTHGDDEAIWRRCKTCAIEFHALRIIQEDR